jgi:hypothetical protein
MELKTKMAYTFKYCSMTISAMLCYIWCIISVRNEGSAFQNAFSTLRIHSGHFGKSTFNALNIKLSHVSITCFYIVNIAVSCQEYSNEKFILIFSSPSVRLSVCRSVCKLLHFRLLLQNHWANFNHTWHRSSMGEGVSSFK